MGTQGPKRLCALKLLAINQIVYRCSLNSKLLYITELIEESSWKIDFFSCFPLPPYACPVTNLHMHSREKSIISASTLPFEILSPLPCPVIFVVKIFALSLPGHSFSYPPSLDRWSAASAATTPLNFRTLHYHVYGDEWPISGQRSRDMDIQRRREVMMQKYYAQTGSFRFPK